MIRLQQGMRVILQRSHPPRGPTGLCLNSAPKNLSSPLVLKNQGDSLRLRIENHHQRGAAMLAQGVLGFQYEAERRSGGLTSLAGLPLYLDLVHSSGLAAAIRRHVQVAGRQGWLDIQMALAVVFLNLAGGDCVEDLERLENDSGFAAVLQAIERDLLSRAERRSLKRRWRRERERTVPSPSALSAWLERFHDPASHRRRLPARRSFRR